MKANSLRTYIRSILKPDNGIVYLVGAGPGDAGLITVRGVECLKKADVVVYDNLANPALLGYAPEKTEFIYAGKMADQHTKSQDEINQILKDRAASGQVVVRLKGGDPFLFGRGGEEAGWLNDHGIAWEVVPGISSAVAVPAYAGIPVTHRIVNGSLHVVTGHESKDGVGPDVDWSVLAKSRGTIVILMGVKNLPMISSELMRHGLSGETPVAMIRWGSLPEQTTLVSRLDRVAEDVARAGMKPPAICVIGEVVRLRKELAWVEKRPLFGIRVAVTRPAGENDTLTAALEKMGAAVVSTPTLKVFPLELTTDSRETFNDLIQGKFDWIAITSGNGAREFVRLLADEHKDARSLANCKLAAIGQRTAEALKSYGLIADLIASDSTQEGLVQALLAEKPRNVLIARALRARTVMETALTEAGVGAAVLPLYDTVPDHRGIAHLSTFLKGNRKTDVITFTSARTFEALVESSGESASQLLAGCAVAVIGPVTRKSVEKAGVTVSIEADRADMESLASAVLKWHQNEHATPTGI